MCRFAREHYGLELFPGTIFDVPVKPGTIDLLTLFDRHDYNAFPVVGQGGELVGIVSKLDVLRRFVAGAGKPGNLEEGVSAADLMQQEVVSVPAEDSLADAGGLMVGANLRSVPVTHGRDAGGLSPIIPPRHCDSRPYGLLQRK